VVDLRVVAAVLEDGDGPALAARRGEREVDRDVVVVARVDDQDGVELDAQALGLRGEPRERGERARRASDGPRRAARTNATRWRA
jgi:hypothetical protein